MTRNSKKIIEVDILNLVASTLGSKVVRQHLDWQEKALRREKRVLHSLGSPEMTSDVYTSIDHLLTICRYRVTQEQYQELLLSIGNIYKSHGMFDNARRMFNEAIAYGRKTHAEKVIAESLLQLGDVYSREGKWKESRRDLLASLKVFTKLNDFGSIARVENILGTSYAEQGRMKQANRCFSMALQNAERSSQRSLVGTAFMNLGIVNNIIGNWDEALNCYRRASALFESSTDMVRIAEVHHNMGMSYLSKKKYPEALNSFDKSLEYSVKYQYPGLIGLSKLGKANVKFSQGDPALALALSHQALENFKSIDDRLGIADVYKLKAMILREMKEYELALAYFQSSVRINEEYHNLLNLGETYREIGFLEQHRGQAGDAVIAFATARNYFEKIGATAETREIAIHMSGMEPERG
jgi:tetratricopeptide (TPR) repeat protein